MGCSIDMHSVHKIHRLLLQHRSHKMYSHTLVLSQCVLLCFIIQNDIHTIHWMVVVLQCEVMAAEWSDDTFEGL